MSTGVADAHNTAGMPAPGRLIGINDPEIPLDVARIVVPVNGHAQRVGDENACRYEGRPRG